MHVGDTEPEFAGETGIYEVFEVAVSLS